MSLFARFFVAWLIGFPAILLAGNVDDRFISLCGVSGVLLLGMGIRGLTDDLAWERFVVSQRRWRRAYPGGRVARLVFGVGVCIIGAGFTLAGVLGVLAIFGLYEFPSTS